MEISCESDHEDASSHDSGVQKEQIECNEKLSDSETDSDDPFSDSENSNWRNVVQATCRPFLSRTVKELLKDKSSSKLLLQVLTEQHSETVDSENKQIACREDFQLTDASTETAASRKEELTLRRNEHNVSALKQCVNTCVLPGQMSSNSDNLSVHSVQIGVCSGNENEKHVRMEPSDAMCEAIQNSLMESSSSRTDETRGEGNVGERTPCNNNEMKSVDLIFEPVQNLSEETSPSRTDKLWNEESCRGKTPCSDNGISSVDPVSESIQNSPMKSFLGSSDDKTESEESQNKTPRDNNKTESGDPISEAVQNSLMNCSTRIDNNSSNEGTHREVNRCSSSGVASVDPVTETIQNSSVEISHIGTDDSTKNEKTQYTNSETESVYAVSEAVQNSLMESSSARIDNKTGNEKCGRGKTLCENSRIDSAQNFDTDAETNNIHMNKSIQKRTTTKGSCSTVNRKRKYQCISSNDMSSGNKANSCGTGRRAGKTVRTGSPSTGSSYPPVIVPIMKLEKTEIPVNDFTTLVNSAMQKKLIKPCFVSVMKLSRSD
jgi:hypothetical protein